MEVTDLLNVLFRWGHVVAGVIWVGSAFWVVFVQMPSTMSLDPPTQSKFTVAILPRAMRFFRWSSIYTWVLGILLLGLVFYHGGILFENEADLGWSFPAVLSLILVFGMYGIYTLLIKSGLARNSMAFGAIAFVIIAAMVYLMKDIAGFSYRAYNIHLGVMFGTLMLANGMRSLPAQRRILAAMKEGKAPDPTEMQMFGTMSRHNVYLSVPLIYTMINAHTVVPGASSTAYLLGAVLLGWLLVALMFNRSAAPKEN